MNKLSYRFAGLALCALVFSCLSGCEAPVPAADGDAARESLIQADLAFAGLALEEGLPRAYEEYLADDAVQLPDGDLPIAGKDAIYKNIVAVSEGADFLLTWEPVAAEVSVGGDLGYTWGSYYFEAQDENGQPFAYEGKYANIWKKSADGRWQILLDISNQNRTEYADDLSAYDDAFDSEDEFDSESLL